MTWTPSRSTKAMSVAPLPVKSPSGERLGGQAGGQEVGRAEAGEMALVVDETGEDVHAGQPEVAPLADVIATVGHDEVGMTVGWSQDRRAVGERHLAAEIRDGQRDRVPGPRDRLVGGWNVPSPFPRFTSTRTRIDSPW